MSKEQLQYCTILKTRINVTDMEQTISYITDRLEDLKGNYICVSNVHTTVMAFRDKAYRRVQNSAAMALPDGQPLSIVSRLSTGTTGAGTGSYACDPETFPGKRVYPLLLRQHGADAEETGEGTAYKLSGAQDRRYVCAPVSKADAAGG